MTSNQEILKRYPQFLGTRNLIFYTRNLKSEVIFFFENYIPSLNKQFLAWTPNFILKLKNFKFKTQNLKFEHIYIHIFF